MTNIINELEQRNKELLEEINNLNCYVLFILFKDIYYVVVSFSESKRLVLFL